jgi:hypothetical protein
MDEIRTDQRDEYDERDQRFAGTKYLAADRRLWAVSSGDELG